jgi:competence protein ComEC
MKSIRFTVYVGTSFLIVLITGLYVWYISRPPLKLELFVFDTKGKPSIFIRTPEDIRILINGGANSGVIRYITNALPFYSRRIDTVIVTSDEGDYVSGLVDVISRYKIGQVIVPAITSKKYGFSSSTDLIYETFLGTIEDSHVPMREVQRGDRFDFGKLPGDILFPETTDRFKYSKSSPPELVIKFTYGQISFLLLGDMGTKGQRYLIDAGKSGDTLRSNFLIFSHNISAATLSSGIINAVKPEFVVYSQSLSSGSSGRDKSKADPLYSVLDSHRLNIKQKSTIEVLSDGESVEILR